MDLSSDDLEILEQSDSGMESLTASKGDTPERKPDDVFFVPNPIDPNAPGDGAFGAGVVGAGGVGAGGFGAGGVGEGAAGVGGYGISANPNNAIMSSLKEYDDEPDETLSERLWGLTEMFPSSVRKGTYKFTTKTWSGVKTLYGVSRTVVWVIASSSVIMFAPVIFEVQRAQVEEMQKSQQKQVLLGTNAMPPIPR